MMIYVSVDILVLSSLKSECALDFNVTSHLYSKTPKRRQDCDFGPLLTDQESPRITPALLTEPDSTVADHALINIIKMLAKVLY